MASTLEKIKYKRIAETLRNQIQNGHLRPDDRLPSFSEMRLEFGATPTTVERVYSLLEQDGLVKREKGRGIFVAQPQSLLTNGVIGIIGLNTDNSTSASRTSQATAHPWGMHLLEGIRDIAGQVDKEVLLYPRQFHSTIKWEKVDGILNLDPQTQRVVPYLPTGMPFVSALTKVTGYVSVVADEAGGVRAAVEHLLNLGHRRIAHLIMHATSNVPFLRPRVTAYQEALRDGGVEMDTRWLRHLNPEGGASYQEYGYNNMKQWLADNWHSLNCTALLAQNDDTAIGAMQALHEAGIRVPDDLSVIGFDGTEIGKYCMPHLTSVAMPLREIGMQAMRLLLQQIQEEPVPLAAVELPTHLEVRASTAMPPTR